MMKILMITSLYPSDDMKLKNSTSVCHYFAKEWKNMGHDVRVIFFYNIYPLLYYPILSVASKMLANKFDAAILSKRLSNIHSYEIDGVKISRIPIFKRTPRGAYSEKEISRQICCIEQLLKEEKFTPTLILAHFIHPGLEMVSKLKLLYPKAISSVTLHGKVSKFKFNEQKLIDSIDFIGFRSFPIGRSFKNIYGEHKSFHCFSGIPNSYLSNKHKNFDKGIKNFIYVGNFMKRKYPSAVVMGVANGMKGKEYTLTFVGDGQGIKLIKNVARNTHTESNVIFKGRIAREKVKEEMDWADVFVMISEKETFGLVYLEAMARGCITIASRDEGMDGIICDGENGFLCRAGDSVELSIIIKRISNLSSVELERISLNAVNTAVQMTDTLMAERYLNYLRV